MNIFLISLCTNSKTTLDYFELLRMGRTFLSRKTDLKDELFCNFNGRNDVDQSKSRFPRLSEF